jgi:ABC-type antimicrobial peptide transport system permease subunit
LGRLVSAFLFQVQPTDVPTFVAVGFLVMVVTAAACLAPVRRAIRIDPLVALRLE